MMSQRSRLRLLTLVSLVIGSSALAGPLHDAAEQGNLNEVSLLITQGADVNAKDQQGLTPLHQAVSPGSAENCARPLPSRLRRVQQLVLSSARVRSGPR